MPFGVDDAIILGMIAAGAITSLSSTGKNIGLIRQGRQLETAALETNLEALRTQTEEASLEALNALRENVANQVVINAARGTASGAGSATSSINKSESMYAHDEKVRRMNLLVKEGELRAANVLSGLHTAAGETKLGQSLTNQIFNNLPISSLAKKFGESGTGPLKSEIPSISGLKFQKKAGFGLSEV